MPIPSPNFQRKPYQKQAVQEIASSVVAAIGVLIQLWQTLESSRRPSDAQQLAQALYGSDREAKLFHLASAPAKSGALSVWGSSLTIVGLLALLLFKYLKARDQDQKDDQISNPEGLRGCAHVLYAQLKLRLNLKSDDGQVRVTVHRVTEGTPPELEQVIDYVGTTKPSGKGRRFSIRAGVIGYAARTGQTSLAERNQESTEDHYKNELVSKWGYTIEEARTVSLDRKTIIAVPIASQSGESLGVVLVDSDRANAFDEESVRLITRAAVGFSTYIEERFK